MKRRIAVVTGTRAEFGLLESTIAALRKRRGVRTELIVCGMHLLPKFGNTIRDIRSAGHAIAATVRMQRGDDSPLDQARGLARGVAGIAAALHRMQCDRVIVLGDRIEALAGALAATTIGVSVAHIHGGDAAPGDFDGKMRNAITQMANLHLPATAAAARELRRLGAARERMFIVGAPGIDRLRELIDARRGSAPFAGERFAIVAQHAYGRSAAFEQRVMGWILDELRRAGLRSVVIAPNSDRGHQGVLAAIDRHLRERGDSGVEFHRSLPRDEFLRRLLDASLMIGNSSSGLIEAPFAGTPSVDIGDRQAGRPPGGRSVMRAAETPSAIRAAIRSGLALKRRLRAGAKTIYGDGRAGERIAKLVVEA
ncbi:MAG: UDP-N-acetylglucosamine 2-epimerase [Phycisphaerae bacterium]|nr:UDP-N-acetylglucosamine 2-epimerase [Phycisphaerae bacterium]